MGGSVSAGRDNNELIDNLVSGNYIRSRGVEKVFRALDRGDYMTPEAKRQAYKDLAWRDGLLHMSSPCIYSEVMEGLELRPGLSFLNIGSGTGYLSTLAGLILGTSGISHGVEIHPSTVDYATIKLQQFIKKSPSLDYFDFCEPKFFIGNGLNLAPLQSGYDRVYCGAGCPEKYVNYIRYLLKVGGILVVPINDTLQQVKRVSETKFVSYSLMSVSFATLRAPTDEDTKEHFKLVDIEPPRLVMLARARIREALRDSLLERRPELREKAWRRPPRRNQEPRRVIIPIESTPENENLNVLHDLDAESGANEMNALLSLVISMGEDRLAGALRFGSDRGTGYVYRHDRDSHSSDDDDDTDGSTETVEPTTETYDQSIGNEDDTSSRSNQELKEDSEETTHKTDAKDEADNKESEVENVVDSNDEIETDPQSDSSSVDDSKAKNKRLRARLSRTVAKLKRLGKKPFRNTGIAKASTSKVEDEHRNDCEVSSSESDDDEKPAGTDDTCTEDTSQEAGPSTDMEWQELKHPVEDNNGVHKSKAKRQKLDSGIGENSGSAEETTQSDSGSDSDSWTRLNISCSGLADRDDDSSVEEDEASEERRARRKSSEARHREMGLTVKQAVAALPLPHPLKMFVNWGRSYQF
ncbi:unnamed protein product [Pieris macdunnoughi]|uniref:Protein-L-isoaspartate O-methyltransferase domain-containing protein 1 n=1 Tax=Pieris macdunnoughi TaxID=345717 RepID=A0A821RM85_9NEOP|nr:unnamed protein product [Pieris macdunnoughi]